MSLEPPGNRLTQMKMNTFQDKTSHEPRCWLSLVPDRGKYIICLKAFCDFSAHKKADYKNHKRRAIFSKK